MRVLFFHQVSQSLGLEYLAAALKQDGHEVELVFDPGFRHHPYAKLRGLGFLGPSPKEILSRIARFQPDLIALSILTNLYPSLRDFARLVKDHMDVPILAGGPHPTLLPEVVLADGLVDFVCEGEGEDVIRDLVRCLETRTAPSGVPGLWFRNRDGTIGRGPVRQLRHDLDAIAFPDRELFPREGISEWCLSTISMRGCPYHCTYCTNTAFRERSRGRGRFLRRRSVANVVAELGECRSRYRPRLVAFLDQMFALDPPWLEEFALVYREQVGLPFYCNGYAPVLTDGIVDLLAKAGCVHLLIGVEAGDDEIRNEVLGRRMTKGQILAAAERARHAGMYLSVSCMFGMPGETPRAMWETVDLVVRTQANAVKSFAFFPLPGTPLLASCVEKGLLAREDVRAIEEGRGNYHHGSPLKHPHARLAFVLSRTMPVYLGAPDWARRWLRIVMTREWVGLARLLHLVTYPVFVDGTHVMDFLNTVRAALRSRVRRLAGARPGNRQHSGRGLSVVKP